MFACNYAKLKLIIKISTKTRTWPCTNLKKTVQSTSVSCNPLTKVLEKYQLHGKTLLITVLRILNWQSVPSIINRECTVIVFIIFGFRNYVHLSTSWRNLEQNWVLGIPRSYMYRFPQLLLSLNQTVLLWNIHVRCKHSSKTINGHLILIN